MLLKSETIKDLEDAKDYSFHFLNYIELLDAMLEMS